MCTKRTAVGVVSAASAEATAKQEENEMQRALLQYLLENSHIVAETSV